MNLVRSKQRVTDHGEVLTPPALVDAMTVLVQDEVDRIDSRILEPACGSGNFLVPILLRKLRTVSEHYTSNEFERRNHALLALMSIYGIELLADNVAECRAKLLDTFMKDLSLDKEDQLVAAAIAVLGANIVNGDALTMRTAGEADEPITFTEWTYLGRGKFNRRDFRFETMTQMSAFGEEDTLFADLGKHEIFTPIRDHGLLTLNDISGDNDAQGHLGG